MSRVNRLLLVFLLPLSMAACAGHSPRLYTFDDMEVYAAPYQEVWEVVDKLSKQRKWRIDESEVGEMQSYLATDWMTDRERGGDFGSVGISLGKGNKPLDDQTREVAINIRVVVETPSTTRVKVSCLFRIQTTQGQSGSNQTMFGTSEGIVEGQILDTIRSRLVLSQSSQQTPP